MFWLPDEGVVVKTLVFGWLLGRDRMRACLFARVTAEKDGKRHAYWALMESYRTAPGPRQRVVAYLGQLEEPQRLGVKEAAEGGQGLRQKRLFDDVRPQWVEVDVKRVRVENRRDFGGPWLGLEVADRLGLKAFLDRALPSGREDVPWSLMALVLVLCRLCEPSSELHIVEHFVRPTRVGRLVGHYAGEGQPTAALPGSRRVAAAQELPWRFF